MRSIALITALLSASSAYAADCATPYTTDGLIEDLTGVETAMRGYDDAAAAAAGTKLKDGLNCLDEVLPALIAARAYRAVGAGLYAGGEQEPANKWFRTSLELEPTWTYGLQDVPDGHPLRNDFESLKAKMSGDEPALLAGKEFIEGSHYLDGRKVTKPKARLERFHVYQVDNNGVSSYVIDGNAYPAASLTEGAVADAGDDKGNDKDKDKDKDKDSGKNDKNTLTDKQIAAAEKARAKEAAKKEKKAAKVKTTVSSDGTVYYKRQRPKEKTPLMIAGGVIMAGALGLYYGSTRSLKKMESINTAADVNPGLDITQPFKTCRDGQDLGENGCVRDPADEVDRLAGVTNRLVVASVAVFAIGAGTTTWGVILDGGTAVPTVNIRF